uniref:Reverse transcriptase domain-containing protein n=1 Tax=Tanacetum cinerariifolium TaxID=118510 RepID=A0A6L2KV98_TANCI|nr:reverse transcriptase domain-containing protein [Tanacetum cinerariifolium]
MDAFEDVDVVQRVPVRGEGASGTRGGAIGSRCIGGAAGSRGGASGLIGRGAGGSGGTSGSRGRGAGGSRDRGAGGSKKNHVSTAGTKKRQGKKKVGTFGFAKWFGLQDEPEQTQDQVHPQEKPQQAALRIPCARILQRKLEKQGITFEIHHGGCFTLTPSRSYVGGHVSSLNVVDIEEFCLHDLKDMKWKYVKDNKIILVYVEHESSNVDSNIFVTPKKGVAIAVGNHLKKAPIEIDSSPDVNRNLTPMCHRNLTKEWEHVSSKALSIGEVMKILSKKQPASFVKGPIVVKNVDPFKGLDEILCYYANTREKITRKQVIVHVGNSFTIDDVLDLEMLFETEGVGPIGKFKEVEVDVDNELEEESDTEENDTSGNDSKDLDYDPKHDEVCDDDEYIVEDVHMRTTVRNDDNKNQIQTLQQELLEGFGVDANNRIYPVAYAIVEAESKASWCWFLNLERILEYKPTSITLSFLIGKREYLMKRIVVVQKVIAKTVGPLIPFVTALFDAIKKATDHIVQWNEGHLYQVTRPYRDQCIVNMDRRVCSCKKWELTRVPCKHVVTAIYNMSENSMPPKKRKKAHDDIASQSCLSGKLSKKGRSVKCSKCGNLGHNRQGCRGQGGARQATGARNVSSQAAGRANSVLPCFQLGTGIPICLSSKRKQKKEMNDSQPREEGAPEVGLEFMAKAKTTPRKLVYDGSEEEENSNSSRIRGSSKRLSNESFDTSRARDKDRSSRKSQRILSRSRESSDLRRSERLENRSKSKAKPKRERGLRAQMFRQTLSGALRNWFDDLDSKCMDIFEELSQKFLEEFSQQKSYANDKDPTDKKRMNEGLQAFMDRFKYESSHIKGVTPVDEMFERVMEFIRGEATAGSTEAARASQWGKGVICPVWSGGQERTMGRRGQREFRTNIGTCAPYLRRDTFTPLTKTSKEILAMEKANRRGCFIRKADPLGERYTSWKLEKWKSRTREHESLKHGESSFTDDPIILEGTIKGYHVRRIYVDDGSSSEITYEHCFKSFDVDIKSRLRKDNAPLNGFSGETYHPLGLIDLRDRNEEPRSDGFDHLSDDEVLDDSRSRYNENQQRSSMGMQTCRENAESVKGNAMMSPRGRKWDPHGTSVLTSTCQRIGSGCHVAGHGLGPVATCHHLSGSTWQADVAVGLIVEPTKSRPEPGNKRIRNRKLMRILLRDLIQFRSRSWLDYRRWDSCEEEKEELCGGTKCPAKVIPLRVIIEDGTHAVLPELEMYTWSMVVSKSCYTSLEEEKEELCGGTKCPAKVIPLRVCMRTRSSSNLPVESLPNPSTSNPKRRKHKRSKQHFILEESPIDTMVDQRTMEELLRAPTEGYAEAIVVPLIRVEQFELKHSLINMMTSDQFFGLEKDNPHDHIRWFNKITSTIKYKDVPNFAIKLMLFPFSLTGAACRWLEKEPPYSILTWEDLVSKFINEFFPPSRTTNLRNEISNFQQRFDESFHEAWDRYEDLLCACPHHGFTELHQLDTFYNELNPADQDSLNSAAGGSLLERQIAKLTYAVNQQTSVVTTTMTAILNQFQATPPLAFVKSAEEICVTCGGAHPYYQCPAAGGNTFLELRDNIQGYIAAATVNYNQGNFVYHPLGSRSLPSNTIANPKGELKAITTRSGIVLEGPSFPIPPLFINPEEDEHVEETLTDQDLAEYTIKVPPPLDAQAKTTRKYKVQIRKFWQMFKQLHINVTLADALILIPKYQKMFKALLSNKKKLLELANTPLNENCSAVILKKLPKKLRDPGKFLIPCGFSKLKCKSLADLGASINLMPLSVWKKLGLPELISTRMTLELANRAICTPAGIARDVFVPVGKFTFPGDFVIGDYESDHRVTLILGRPFLWTARALIDVHREEMILRDEVKDDIFDPEVSNVLPEKFLDLDFTKDLHPPLYVNPLSGNTTSSSSPKKLLEEFADELTLITFLTGNDNVQFDIEFVLKEIEYLLHHDPRKDIGSILKDSIDQSDLADLNNNLVDSMPEMFTDEHALDYSSFPLYDEYDDDLFKVESDTKNVYDDPFDSKGEKIKKSKLLVNELDLLCDFLLPSEYDSFFSKDFSKVDALPSTNNEDKVFNPRILIQETLFEVITHVAPEKNEKKLAISHASLILKDFDPPLYELSFFKEVTKFKILLPFSSKNKEKVFKPGIHTSE